VPGADISQVSAVSPLLKVSRLPPIGTCRRERQKSGTPRVLPRRPTCSAAAKSGRQPSAVHLCGTSRARRRETGSRSSALALDEQAMRYGARKGSCVAPSVATSAAHAPSETRSVEKGEAGAAAESFPAIQLSCQRCRSCGRRRCFLFSRAEPRPGMRGCGPDPVELSLEIPVAQVLDSSAHFVDELEIVGGLATHVDTRSLVLCVPHNRERRKVGQPGNALGRDAMASNDDVVVADLSHCRRLKRAGIHWARRGGHPVFFVLILFVL